MPRISKPAEERKREIIETALALFSEKGYENTTIQDIADRMNVATGLCYRYFKSKQEIFAATSEHYAKRAAEKLHSTFPTDASAIEKLNTVIKSLFDYAVKHNEFEASYHSEPEIGAAHLDSFANQVTQQMMPIIEQGVSEGVFQCSDIPNTVYFLAFGIIHMVHIAMPKSNPRKHIISFIPLLKELCIRVLKITTPNDIGIGWE